MFNWAKKVFIEQIEHKDWEFRERVIEKIVVLFLHFNPHTKKSTMPGKGPVLPNWFEQCQLADYISCAMALGLHEWNPAGRQISCLSRHSLFCVSWARRYFSSKMFLQLTSAVSVYMEKEFKFLLWPVARPHLVPSQAVLLCNNGNIWEF